MKKTSRTIKNNADSKSKRRGNFQRTWQLYVFSILPVVLFILFNYIPIAGNVIAFQDYSVRKGLLGSDFVGLHYFRQFFNLPIFGDILRNTLAISVWSLVVGFPFPILLALAFNELQNGRHKKIMQTITYAPYFISTVVMVSILMQVFSYRFGVVNEILKALGQAPYDFIGSASAFRPLYIGSGIWQGAGYSAVLYIAALSGVDPTLYEAAVIDGASKLQRVWYIDLPSILPTIVITFILNAGSILNVGFEKVFLMQNPANYSVSEIISTYVYKIGVEQAQFSLSTAIGLFNAVVNFVTLYTVNQISKRISEVSLF